MPPISAKRKIDAVLTICQNNDSESIEITAANKAAARLTGVSPDTLKTKKLTDILPENIKETVESMVEFSSDGVRDLASVLRKMLHFCILNRNGEEIPVNLKVFYIVSENNHPCYELLMRDVTLIKKLEELRTKSVEKHSHQPKDTDSEIGLAGIITLKENLNFISGYITGSTAIEVTFAAIKIDNLEKLTKKYGEQSAAHIMKQVGAELTKISRAEDTVALINDTTIGLILLDCNQEDAHNVLNRYRLKISNSAIAPNEAKKDSVIRVTPSIGFKEIKPQDTIESLVETTRENLKKAREEGGDKVIG